MVIQTDTRQKMQKRHHKIKEKHFTDNGIKVIHSKMLVGDYCIPSNGSVVVDTKQDCVELYADLISDHKRFHDECVTAQECGIKLYILVENNLGFTKIDDIIKWKNPLWFQYWKDINNGKHRKEPASNQQLLKIMYSMSRDYGVEFKFCKTSEAGKKIIDLLTGVGNESHSENDK